MVRKKNEAKRPTALCLFKVIFLFKYNSINEKRDSFT